MNHDLIITEINNVIYVDQDMYREPETVFHHELEYHELIFNFSGHSTIHFNGRSLQSHPGTLRFLPKGCSPDSKKAAEGLRSRSGSPCSPRCKN